MNNKFDDLFGAEMTAFAKCKDGWKLSHLPSNTQILITHPEDEAGAKAAAFGELAKRESFATWCVSLLAGSPLFRIGEEVTVLSQRFESDLIPVAYGPCKILEQKEGGYEVSLSLDPDSDESEFVKLSNIFKSERKAHEASLRHSAEVQEWLTTHDQFTRERMELVEKWAEEDTKKNMEKLATESKEIPEQVRKQMDHDREKAEEALTEETPVAEDLVALACKVTKYLENNGPRKRGAIAKSLRTPVKDVQKALDILMRDNEVSYEDRGKTFAIDYVIDASEDFGLAEIAAPAKEEVIIEEPLFDEILEALKDGALNARAIAQTLAVNPERIAPSLIRLQDEEKIRLSNGFWKMQKSTEEQKKESSLRNEILEAISSKGTITFSELAQQFEDRPDFAETKMNLFLDCELGLSAPDIDGPTFRRIEGDCLFSKDDIISRMRKHRRHLWKLLNEKKTLTIEEACLDEGIEWSMLQVTEAAFVLEEAFLIAINDDLWIPSSLSDSAPVYCHFLHRILNGTVHHSEFCEEFNISSAECDAFLHRSIKDGFVENYEDDEEPHDCQSCSHNALQETEEPCNSCIATGGELEHWQSCEGQVCDDN